MCVKKGLCTLTVVYEQDEPLIYSCFWVQYTAYGKKAKLINAKHNKKKA